MKCLFECVIISCLLVLCLLLRVNASRCVAAGVVLWAVGVTLQGDCRQVCELRCDCDWFTCVTGACAVNGDVALDDLIGSGCIERERASLIWPVCLCNSGGNYSFRPFKSALPYKLLITRQPADLPMSLHYTPRQTRRSVPALLFTEFNKRSFPHLALAVWNWYWNAACKLSFSYSLSTLYLCCLHSYCRRLPI